MFLLHCFVILCIIQEHCQAKTIKKGQASLLDPWQGKWFPYAPGEPHVNNQIRPKDDWLGKWFPHKPGEPSNSLAAAIPDRPTLELDICDDGMHNVATDYDPSDVRQNYNHLCLSSNRSVFDANMSREAVLTEHFLPSAFMPPSMCLNESIAYTHQPPTNGAFRPLPAVYGTYKFLPPQRYLRNLAEGAIVMLYHPCAFQGQVEQLKLIVRSCLYRHIITPTQTLTPERPLALLGWSSSLAMSVVDKHLVTKFIFDHAKRGPLALPNLSRVIEKRKGYSAALLTEAHLVTDLDDTELCGYQEM